MSTLSIIIRDYLLFLHSNHWLPHLSLELHMIQLSLFLPFSAVLMGKVHVWRDSITSPHVLSLKGFFLPLGKCLGALLVDHTCSKNADSKTFLDTTQAKHRELFWLNSRLFQQSFPNL